MGHRKIRTDRVASSLPAHQIAEVCSHLFSHLYLRPINLRWQTLDV